MNFSTANLRKEIPKLKSLGSDEDFIYFDNAASSLMHETVVNRLQNYHSFESSNVHRGAYALSQQATENYEKAREQVHRFLGLNPESAPSVVFTRGTTESLNLVAHSWAIENLKPDDEILITECDHHSNILPWQIVAKKTGARLRFVPLEKKKSFSIQDFESLVSPKTRLISTFWYSNALGWANPIKDLSKLCRSRNIKFCLDAAQVPLHHSMNLSTLAVDFLAFSGHKMMGPHGIGALYINPQLQKEMVPYQVGGSMIDRVSIEKTTYADFPQIFEAGTPNVGGAIALGEACEIIASWPMEQIQEEVKEKRRILVEGLKRIGDFEVLDFEAMDPGSVVSFVHKEAHPTDVASILDRYGVAVRSGHHCTQPLMEKLKLPGTVRISLAPYNSKEEVEKCLKYLEKVKEFL